MDASYEISDRLTLSGGARYTWEEKAFTGRNQVFYQLLGGAFDAALTPAATLVCLAVLILALTPLGCYQIAKDFTRT